MHFLKILHSKVAYTLGQIDLVCHKYKTNQSLSNLQILLLPMSEFLGKLGQLTCENTVPL